MNEDNNYFCRLVYTDFYKRLDKFFKEKYKVVIKPLPDLGPSKQNLSTHAPFAICMYRLLCVSIWIRIWGHLYGFLKRLRKGFMNHKYYGRMYNFIFKTTYNEKINNNYFNPDSCSDGWRCRLKRFVNFTLEKGYLNVPLYKLKKKYSTKQEAALIVNVSEKKGVNDVLNYFHRIAVLNENYAKQVVLITICLWMTILNKRDFFEDGDHKHKNSKFNKLFDAFQVFPAKKDNNEATNKNDKATDNGKDTDNNDKATEKTLISPSYKNDVNFLLAKIFYKL